MLPHQSLHLGKLMGSKVSGIGKLAGFEPKLREFTTFLNMNMRGLISVVTEEEEPVRPESLYSW